MATHHYQCMYCYCTTRMWTEDDGTDDFYGGAVENCGCTSGDVDADDDDDWDDD